MLVPLTVKDHLDRARLVYGTRTGIIDEPNQPAQPLPELSYGEFASRDWLRAFRPLVTTCDFSGSILVCFLDFPKLSFGIL